MAQLKSCQTAMNFPLADETIPPLRTEEGPAVFWLEVVGDADHWIVDVVESAGFLRFQTEVWGLHQ